MQNNSGVKKLTLVILLCATYISAIYAQDHAISAAGQKLKAVYLAMDVEHLWQSGAHIDWQTGRPDDPTATHEIKTHCSAFVAALCERQDIYILRPPQHKQELLANAQSDWLASKEAQDKGWRPVPGENIYLHAQEYANKGHVVVAVYKSPDAHEPGHIAAVIPYHITDAELSEAGPKLISASTHNYNYTSLRAAFKRHISAWPTSAVLFYYNEKKLE